MTNSTRLRNDNLRRLVAELQQGEMSQSDICGVFNCSRSGACVYLACLGDLIETHVHGLTQPHTYRITDDQGRIDAFLAGLAHIEPRRVRERKPRSMIEALRRDPTRHIHIMDDDAPFRVPVCHVRPQHPAIHAAFWGVTA